MSYVSTSQFVAALAGLGIKFPKNTRRARIVLVPGSMAIVECELICEMDTAVAERDAGARSDVEGPIVVKKRFLLVEDSGE